jgi:hypothetical protein
MGKTFRQASYLQEEIMYEIKVLSNNDFDSLPVEITRGSDISDSLGFADPRTGKAYVRYTAHPELQKYLINHELEELTTNEHNHEDENGIRHKKFFKDMIMPLFTPFLNMTKGIIPGIGNMFGGGQQQQQQPQQQQPMGNPFSGQRSPLGSFSAPSQASNSTPGSVNSNAGVNPGMLNSQPLSPELQERVKGMVSGRMTF